MQAMLTQLIGAIGERDFAAVAGETLRSTFAFDLAAIFLHRDGATPRLLFEDFGTAGGRTGIDNYVRSTHRLNPLLLDGPREGVVRARDFEGIRGAGASRWIVAAPDEELGYRTIGWPERLEEVALHFPAWGGRIEFGLYRARGRRPGRDASQLAAILPTLRATFLRHHALAGESSFALDRLTARENQVCELLLAGCSSEAIALRLGTSRHTVKDHRKSIYRKLGVASLAELFARFGPTPLQGDGESGPDRAITGRPGSWSH